MTTEAERELALQATEAEAADALAAEEAAENRTALAAYEPAPTLTEPVDPEAAARIAEARAALTPVPEVEPTQVSSKPPTPDYGPNAVRETPLEAAEPPERDEVALEPDPAKPQTLPEDRLADFGINREDYDEGQAGETLDGWTVEDVDGATWAARKHARLSARKEAFRKIRDDEKARLDAWFQSETDRIEADMRFFAGRLESFHRRMLATDPRNAKTVRLPNGTELRSQAGKLAVEVTDPEAFVAWCEANEHTDEMLRYPDPEPQKKPIADTFGEKAKSETEPGSYSAFDPATGEAVPGVEIVRKPRTFTIGTPVEG